MGPDTQPRPPYPPALPRRPQSGAVAALAATLVALLTIWIVGAILLIRYAPDLGELPGSSPSPSAPATR